MTDTVIAVDELFLHKYWNFVRSLFSLRNLLSLSWTILSTNLITVSKIDIVLLVIGYGKEENFETSIFAKFLNNQDIHHIRYS